ncbi:hypothetical protein [Mongoliibacter ruber]|uniref:Terminase family protein n=1 Tax=Mongoliibacter ruber TaxID=1750599 RepID=A0A2T0WV68_9BACT|nr:hypothetical protein [Mongoliibacter ruber]PRY90577.1 hypothetical protein CLW00_101240 [Mongoliibacter ruber]
MTKTKIHYNIPQLEYSLVRPQIGTCIWGRGTGKTEGPGSEFIVRNAMDMPGSLGGIVSITYDKLLNMIIPALKIGWERMGYKENVHYWIRKAPPEHLNIPKAYRQPDTNQHIIKWFNGSAQLLISIDRIHIANGASLAYIYADEVKFFPREKFKEVLLTLRGQAALYGHLSCCESLLITTDQPRPEMPGDWVFELEKDHDPETTSVILGIQYELSQLSEELNKTKSKRRQKEIARQIDRYLDNMNELRRGLNFVSRASTIDNVHALGINVIENYKKTLTPYEFALSVLNKKQSKGENDFYYLLSEDKHGYYAPNIDFIDSLDNKVRDTDSRWDGDIILEAPIDIACDYNSAINWMVIGQEKEESYDILKSMFVLKPKKIKHLVNKFDKYYADKKRYNNTINFYYDHTAIGENAISEISFYDEWVNKLSDKGWNVNAIWIGKASNHRARYKIWEWVLGGDEGLKPFRFNVANNQELMVSMHATKTKKDKYGNFEKDKTSEIKKSVPPEFATHGGEACDTLIWGVYKPKLSQGTSTMLAVTM